MSSSTRGTNSGRAEKRITTGTRISGAHGRLIANPNPLIKRRVHERVYGRVVEAVGQAKYRVRFDDGSEKVCASRTLRTEREEASIPQSELAAASSNEEARVDEAEADGTSIAIHYRLYDILTNSIFFRFKMWTQRAEAELHL